MINVEQHVWLLRGGGDINPGRSRAHGGLCVENQGVPACLGSQLGGEGHLRTPAAILQGWREAERAPLCHSSSAGVSGAWCGEQGEAEE